MISALTAIVLRNSARSRTSPAGPVLNDPLQVMVGPRHPLAAAASLRPTDLAGHRIWIPGIKPGSEWEAYYRELAPAFGLSIDRVGPNFGSEAVMEAIAESGALATLVGSRDRYVWPAAHDLRRIPLTAPSPVYPHTLLSHSGNRHPALATLHRHLLTTRLTGPADSWAPPGWVS